MVAPYLIGMYWKKANHAGALSSFLSGTLSWIVLSFFFYGQTFAACAEDVECATWDAIYIASTPAFLISVIVFIVVSLLTQKVSVPKVLTDIDGKPVDMKNPLGIGVGEYTERPAQTPTTP
jgi:Na+/proline symporter